MNEEFNETAQEWLEEDLFQVLKKTRQEPGLSIEKTAEIIREVFKKEEIDHLINYIIK